MKVLDEPIFSVREEFRQGSFVFPNPWMRAEARTADRQELVARVGFGVSPVFDRVYVDDLQVEETFRRRGAATALLVHVVRIASGRGPTLQLTALRETYAASVFWDHLRNGGVPGLAVTLDVRVGEMADEKRRWLAQLVAAA